MRVAVVAPPWLPVPPPAYGGTEAVVDSIARGLSALDHDVVLIAHPDSSCPVHRAWVVPAEDSTPMGRASIELEHAIGAYRIIVDDGGFDVVSDHTIGGPVHASGHRTPPIVATNHNPFSRTRNAIFGTLVGHGAIVAISHAHAATTQLPIAAVIHHGLDVDEFPAGDGAGGYLAMLTRMTPDKGIERAIDLARRAGVPLRIAAKVRDPLEHEFLERIRPQFGGGIEFLGEVDADQKRALLAGASALINPIQWHEPFGMAMLESLACGTPVIGTPRGAAPEIVTPDVGVLADEDQDLIAAIHAVGSIDRERCRARVREHFSIEAMCTKYVDAFAAEIERCRQ